MRRPLPLDRVAGLLTAEEGLTTAQAFERRQRHGPNDIVEVPGNPWWDLARDTARDPMIWFLVGTGVLYAFVGEGAEALTLLAAIAPLVGMDAFLHRRTRASTEGLQSRLAAHATVLRDGTLREVAAVDVVPGDLTIVGAGEAFPADGIVVDGRDLQVDESALTGEAYPVAKRPLTTLPPDGPEPAVAGEHWGLAGTRLLTGRAAVRVAYTGPETLYGEIVRSAVRGASGRTPLQAAIANLVGVLVAAALVVCFILAFVRLRQGYGWVDALVSAVTLAVAALPEEFPVVFTFYLGVGVYRLARRQALVRRAVSVENIGRISTICSDKTGTITEGRLELTHFVPAEDTSIERLLAFAILASRRDSGDPLDTAIIHAASTRALYASGGAGPPDAGDGAVGPSPETLAIFPFTEDRKRETLVAREPDGGIVAATKGAVEIVLVMTTLSDRDRTAWTERVLALAEAGHKVIACAWRPLDDTWAGGEPDRGYRFAGLLAFEDPVREGVAHAIAVCRNAGIHTIMVTGDHPVTARAVACEIGLGDGAPIVLSGDEVETRLAAGGGAVEQVDVIARAVPAQKLALVRALQEAGEIVAVTGDGVNDVPALQAADIGIAMGERGTRSAREVAAIVLLDDNFRTIVRAIGEGRQLFRNLRLSFQYLLMIHIPLVTTAALIPLAGYPLLYLPIHVVWLEMIIHPTALLVFQDLPEPGVLERAQRRRRARFFSWRDWLVIAVAGGLATGLITTGYVRSLGMGRNVEHARAMALMTLTLTSAAIAAVLSRLRTWPARTIAAATIALSLALVQVAPLAARLHVQPLHVDDLGIALAGSLLVAAAAVPAGRKAGGGRRASRRAPTERSVDRPTPRERPLPS